MGAVQWLIQQEIDRKLAFNIRGKATVCRGKTARFERPVIETFPPLYLDKARISFEQLQNVLTIFAC